MWSQRFDTDRPDPDLGRLLIVALVAAVAFYLASNLPAPLVAVALRQMLFVAALGGMALALLRHEPLWGPNLTAWDQAALLLAASLLAGFFVDPEAANRALAELQAAHG